MKKQLKDAEDWEGKFDSTFGDDVQRGPSGTEGAPIGKDIKDFIRTLLAKERNL